MRRDKQRLDQALDYITSQSGSKNVQGYICDLASLQDVRKLGQQLLGVQEPIHTLINNAGVYENRFRCEETPTGSPLLWHQSPMPDAVQLWFSMMFTPAANPRMATS